MDMEDKIDQLMERVEQLAARLENIEYVLGVSSAEPLTSVNIDALNDRLVELETAWLG